MIYPMEYETPRRRLRLRYVALVILLALVIFLVPKWWQLARQMESDFKCATQNIRCNQGGV